MTIYESQLRHINAVTTLVAVICLTVSPQQTQATPADQGISIHRYADFSQQALLLRGKSAAMLTTHTATQRAQVGLNGKQLTLTLQDHRASLGPALSRASSATLLRGNLEGVPHSWVRLSQVASGTHGLIWDGAELYAIEPSAEVGRLLDQSAPLPTGDTIIFRLSDTSIDLGEDYCGSSDHTPAVGTGMATYQALATDLTQQLNNDNMPTLRLEMQLLADAAFRAEYDSDQAALDAIAVRLNNVDGIYSSQLGLAIQATDIQIFAQDPVGLSTSTVAGTLLSSLGQLRVITPGMSSYAATHLLTGRDIDGDTLGIAYIGNMCGARYAASLSEVRNRGAWIDSLVAAHELGHQFGAVHDGTGICTGTVAEGYLMSSLINGNDAFSSCSRDSILLTMQSAACLVPINTPAIGGVTNDAANVPEPATRQGGGGALTTGWLLLLSALAALRMRQLRLYAAQPLHQPGSIKHT